MRRYKYALYGFSFCGERTEVGIRFSSRKKAIEYGREQVICRKWWDFEIETL